jgi:MFS family permease
MPAVHMLGTRLCTFMASQAMSTAIAWHVYSITKQPLAIGLAGLSEFVPMFLLSPYAGRLGDTRDRRGIVLMGAVCSFVTALILFTLTLAHLDSVAAIYAVLVMSGSVRAFVGPAQQALLPSLVTADQLPRAVTIGTLFAQFGLLGGPALGGLLCTEAFGPLFAYLFSLALCAIGAFMMFGVPKQPVANATLGSVWETLQQGLRFVFDNKIILGSISLDLAAVLLGGVVALLPVYARDILLTSGAGYGLLRASPAIGAAMMGFVIARYPIRHHMGRIFFASVFGFGLATLVFALSKNLALSMIALALAGAADMVSMVVRGLVVQALTPAAMRGRVSAVNTVFISASNQLGEFESGLTAHWLGTRRAAVVGACGTLLCTALFMALFPSLRKVDAVNLSKL